MSELPSIQAPRRPDDEADRSGAGARRRPGRLRIALAGGVGALAVTLALIGASALNQPVGAGARDATPAMPDPVPGSAAGEQAGLPPLALVLDAPPPDGIGDLPAAQQIAPLYALTGPQAPARRYVELGAALQAEGLGSEALQAYREATRREPASLGGRVGLVLVPAATGNPGAMADADARLAALERDHPDAQIVSFNRAWLAIYRADARGARTGLERTIELGARTPLGITAADLLAALGANAAPPAP